MKKFTQIVLSALLILMSVNISTSAQEKEIDLETKLELRDTSMLSGEMNHLQVSVKTTGPKTIVEDLVLELNYNSDLKIDEEYLSNNTPSGITYEVKEDKVIFNFDKVEGGKFYEVPVIFIAQNGIIKNDSKYDFSLKTLSNNYSSEDQFASVTVNASSPLKINKDYIGLAEKGIEGTLGIAPGLTGKWKTKAVIVKNRYGQMFIKEGTKITIREEFDHETLEFVRVDGGVEPTTIEEGVLVWEFDAPSYEEQKQNDNLFFQDFDVIYRVKSDLKIEKKLDDQGASASLEFTNIADDVLIDTDEGRTSLYPSAEDTPEVEGSWWIPGHFGPTSAFGDFSTDFEKMNTRPTVFEWAKLTYAHQIAALEYGEANVYKSYAVSYFINDHLKLDEIKTPGRFLYRPNRQHGDATYLEEQPILDVFFYDKDDNLIASFEDVDQNRIITRKEILADKDDSTHIKKVVYSARKFVPGMIVDEPEVNPNTGFTDLPTYTFSILPSWKEDAVNNMYELKNEKIIEVERSYPSGYKEIYDFRDDAEFDYYIDNNGYIEKYFVGWHPLSAPRWAVVTEDENTFIPTVTNTIELMDHNDGIAFPGSNVLRLTLNNEEVSVGAILENVQSYILLPKTIELDLTSVKDGIEVKEISEDSYNKLYQINWNNSRVIPRDSLSLDIEVKLLTDLYNINLSHFSDLSSNDDFNVLKVDDATLQDSVKVKTPSLLEDLIAEKDLVLSKNHYTVLSDYYILVEKFVKAEVDTEFKKTTSMGQDELVTYKLDFTNKKGRVVDRFGLIDVLPHIGDLGITNFVERGSEFDLVLSGPIKIDDRFEVRYSKDKNPSRQVLNELVGRKDYLTVEGGNEVTWLKENEVDNWNEIYSFHVSLKEGKEIEINENFSLEFTAKLPHTVEVEKDIYAHNSFALTANGSPLIEPLQVSVKIPGKETEVPPKETPEKPPVEPPTPEEPPVEPPTPEEPPTDLPQTGFSNNNLFVGMFFLFSGLILNIRNKKQHKIN